MVKTADGVSQACSRLEIQPGCTGPWVDVGGEMNTVVVPKSTRTTGSTPVFGDARHVIAGGKQPPLTVTIGGVYSEVPTEAFWLIKTLWETPGISDCDKQLCVRWIPKGGSVGDAQYEMTDNPQLVGFQYPALDAGNANPIPFEADIFGYIDSDTFVS